MGVWLVEWMCGSMGGSVQITNYRINLNWDNSILFEDFMVCGDTPSYGWVCGWLDGWLVRCVGYVKSLKIESILN